MKIYTDANMVNAIHRVLKVACPYKTCNAAPGSKCMETYYNAAGIQTRYIDNFHNLRIQKAQTMQEKALDLAHRIRIYLNDLKEKHEAERSGPVKRFDEVV